jgi:TPR repeat protein
LDFLIQNNNDHPTNIHLDPIVLFYYGVYYEMVKVDHDHMIKYYSMAIDLGCTHSMYNLGMYYQEQKNYDSMINYYLMAAELGHCNAISRLCRYYEKTKNYDAMMKYYLMAVELGDCYAMYGLGRYYEKTEKYNAMMKYYFMAINLGDSDAMNNLGLFYEKQGNYDSMIKYYLMAIDQGNSSAMHNLGIYYDEQQDYDNMMKYYLMGAHAMHIGCINSINNYLARTTIQELNFKSIELAYRFLSPTNKELVNKIITSIMNITNHNMLADKMCIICQELSLCIFMSCGHPICKKCFDTSIRTCMLCG